MPVPKTKPGEVAIPLTEEAKIAVQEEKEAKAKEAQEYADRVVKVYENTKNARRKKVMFKLKQEDVHYMLAILKQQAVGYESVLKNHKLREAQPERYEAMLQEYIKARDIYAKVGAAIGLKLPLATEEDIRKAFMMAEMPAPEMPAPAVAEVDESPVTDDVDAVTE